MLRIIRSKEKKTNLKWLQNPNEIKGNNLIILDMKPGCISGMKRGNI
jgi:hypothetical protein